ncbi:MBL fold metallo-hydrolase [Candidatus Woesearchaeota archaeon]|nr:MAG: MBL fold metallo-hydrolase [Candidatus Woesearchaeota archaeon]
MKLTWLGQNSFKLLIGNLKIIIDPFAGTDDDYEPCDLLLITHAHWDHFNLEKARRCINDNTIILGPAAVASQILGCHSVKEDEKHEIGKIRVRVVPAYTITAPRGEHKRGECFGYIIEGENKSIYFAGDTDFIPEMKDIKADIVVLPVGGTYTMGAEEAAKAAEIIKPKIAIPCHYGSVVGTKDDALYFKELVEEKGIKCVILEPGIEKDL